MQVKVLQTNEDWELVFPLIQQLRPHLSVASYMEHLKQMPAYQGWLLVDVIPKVFIGFEERHNFYNGKHLFVHDFVTEQNERSKGYGEVLMKLLIEHGKKNSFDYIALESGLERVPAHQFYENKMEFQKWCYSFRKGIER